LCRAIREKELSSEELVHGVLKRIEAVNPVLNALVALAPESALEAAKRADAALAKGDALGPFHGLPITLKDSIDTAGLVSTAGTWGRREHVPEVDATVASRLRAAGAILLGKTNTPELTLGYDTDNLVYGRTRNPYNLTRTPGGSSGGAAAALAAGLSALDVGSDTAGSIRFPAHCCGIAGLRPTSGRVPRTGHAVPFGGILDSLTQLGPMARYVEDLALGLSVIMGVDWRDPAVIPMTLRDADEISLRGLRVAFHVDNGIVAPGPETADIVRSAALQLEQAGAVVEEARPDGIEDTEVLFNGLFTADGGAWFIEKLRKAGTRKPGERWLRKLKPTTLAGYLELVDRWDSFRVRMHGFLQHWDVILCPVSTQPAPRPKHVSGGDRVFSYTRTYSLTGWPCVSLRAGTSPEGLPLGIQIVGRPWREDTVLAVARHIEQTMGGFQPPPAYGLEDLQPDSNSNPWQRALRILKR
jgi:amidase